MLPPQTLPRRVGLTPLHLKSGHLVCSCRARSARRSPRRRRRRRHAPVQKGCSKKGPPPPPALPRSRDSRCAPFPSSPPRHSSLSPALSPGRWSLRHQFLVGSLASAAAHALASSPLLAEEQPVSPAFLWMIHSI
ncbi:hypothetical protein PVAP13_5KG404814 [Panicum virgatum]|uniref:Uncharacterized protein n=1 Tax=Panicum virgatum TaxID=38727 RepID=A0A8T0SNC3_PANVG|nr:hypothetical protein PVAP13_5KG404814 [Panicum virgatum]